MTDWRPFLLVLFSTVLVSCAESEQSVGFTRVVDVSGSSTKVLTVGLEGRAPGEPVLFLMAGGGATTEAWGEWLSMISSLAPVVTYDRPGIGESPFDGIDPTPRRVVEHAHELLGVLEVPPPYILVGWSWGGPLIRYYSGAYPEEVVGMVYLDPSDVTASPAENIGASSEEDLRKRQAELDSLTAARNLSPGREAEYRATTGFFRAPVADRGLPDDLDVPTSVVLATLTPRIPDGAPSYMDELYYERMFARRIRQFTEWARERPNTNLIVSTDAGHAVFRDDPTLAMEAVRFVVDAVRSNR